MTRAVSIGVIGGGAIGRFHAETVARRVPGARLAVVADIREPVARELGSALGSHWTSDPGAVIEDQAIDAVVIASPGPTHAELIVQAAGARKAIFCEKPLSWDLASADRALAAVRQSGVLLQIGFQRRFDAGFQKVHRLAASGSLGQIQLLRSTTRDPVLRDPAKVPSWAVFRETLIHDFDVLCWMAGSRPIEVYACAEALVAPAYRSVGLRDTAVATVRFETGALGMADASFQAVYGYDVRAEVFGSEAQATVDPGQGSTATVFSRAGQVRERVFWFLDLFGQAYTSELVAFVQAVQSRDESPCPGEAGRTALAVAVAAIESAQSGQPARVQSGPATRTGEPLAAHAAAGAASDPQMRRGRTRHRGVPR